MKKGFTLIELLIVMVIVGILVTVALPKYHAALERGRAQAALANLKTASDLINTHYVLNNNTYTRTGVVNNDGYFSEHVGLTKARYFTSPTWLPDDAGVPYQEIRTTRMEGNESLYALTARSQLGELKDIICVSSASYCEEIGMDYDETEGKYKIAFTN